jgi:hypothetical protein
MLMKEVMVKVVKWFEFFTAVGGAFIPGWTKRSHAQPFL